MKKTLITFFLLVGLLNATAQGPPCTPPTDFVLIEFSVKIVNDTQIANGFHRTPLSIPNIYLNQDTGTLLFDTPCYECTLELVIPDTDTTVYSIVIPDGADTFQLPEGFIGTFELRIIRDNYMFVGEIEL